MAKRKSNKKTKSGLQSFFFILFIVILGLALAYYFTTGKNPVEEFESQVLPKITGQSVSLTQTDSSAQNNSSPQSDQITQTPSSQQTQQPESQPQADTASKPQNNPTSDFILLPQNLEIPKCAGHNGTADHQIRRFDHYTVCYRESYEEPEWAAYCLEDSELIKNTSRQNDFRADPEITTGSATPADYKSTGYDRGHLAPAADFAFDPKAMSDSFYMSNMTPQAPGLNRQIWQYLESQVRDWAKEYGRVYVITGPVLEKSPDQYKSIGTSNKVAVPEYFYKVLLAPMYQDSADKATPQDTQDIRAIAFIIPNQKCDDTYWDYIVTIDEVERRTGLDFFYLLSTDIQNLHESKINKEAWN